MAENTAGADDHKLAKPHKYGARRVVLDGVRFDSQAEAARYGELQLLERAGVIAELQLQPSYTLQEAFTDRDGRRVRAIRYVADFAYTEAGQLVAEDVKGVKTSLFLLKAKLFAFRYHLVDLRIIRASRSSRASAAPKRPKG